MNTSLKLFGGVLALALTTTACVNDGFGREDWSIPSMVCHNKFDAPTIPLADFVATAPAKGSVIITDEVIIDGYVISSDENSTFYKTIVFQDKPENPAIGLQIEVDRSNNYADFPVGSHIRINAKGLVLGIDRGVVKLGSLDSQYPIGRLDEIQISKHIALVCNNGNPDIVNIVPTELVDLEQIKNPKYVNTLVSVSNVQFADDEVLGGAKTFVNQNPKGDTNRILIDKNGFTSILRTAQYASFGTELLPSGNGKITFVVGKYNTTYQAIIRNLKDIEFSGERTDVVKAKGGSAIAYLKTGEIEDFSTFSTGAASEDHPKYINDPVIGNRYWRVSEYKAKNEKYLQFSYGKGDKPYAKTRFAVPVDFDQMTKFSFKSKDGFNTNQSVAVLRVYYSNDYTANAINPTLVDITKLFTISNTATASGYAVDFVESGAWEKPSTLQGKGFIIFEYEGGGSLPTTTIQLDDLKVE